MLAFPGGYAIPLFQQSPDATFEMERGRAALSAGQARQGIGLGDDEFSPIAIPSLRHLWSNLKTQKDSGEADGYTLRIGCEWESSNGRHSLDFGLSLANDRLFVKPIASTLGDEDTIPRIAYLPPFAGITDREMRLSPAIRRRRIGEGLAGAVIRNLLLDMHQRNGEERARLRGQKSKLGEKDLRELRERDPWERLRKVLMDTFNVELLVSAFREEYHSYIRVEVDKGEVTGYRLKRYPGYSKRDLMVEGSGFLQWLSVYALAVSDDVDLLLLDEPDAHLHPSLQSDLLDGLNVLGDKQILVATHSSEVIRASEPKHILELRPGGTHARYLSDETQKSAALAGLGTSYSPRIDRIRRQKRVLFVEGHSDEKVLEAIGQHLGSQGFSEWVPWHVASGHKERKHLFVGLQAEVPNLTGLSLRDRDDIPSASISEELRDGASAPAGLECRTWRRREIENYLLWPPTLAQVTNMSVDEVNKVLADEFGLVIGATFTASAAPAALHDAHGKDILRRLGASPVEAARALPRDAICDDFKTLFGELDQTSP